MEKTWQELETAKAQIDYIADGVVGISLTLVNDIDSTSNTKKCLLIVCSYINIYIAYIYCHHGCIATTSAFSLICTIGESRVYYIGRETIVCFLFFVDLIFPALLDVSMK